MEKHFFSSRRILFTFIIFEFLANSTFAKNLKLGSHHSHSKTPETRSFDSYKNQHDLTVGYYPNDGTYSIPHNKDCLHYGSRIEELLTYQSLMDSTGPYVTLAKLQRNIPLMNESAAFGHQFDKIDQRLDAADISIHGYIRLLMQFENDSRLSHSFYEKTRNALISFKYWPDELADYDEFGNDEMVMYTENHYILFASAGYLTSQMMPETIFTASGETGLQRIDKFRQRIYKWMQLRFKTGFSEFLSNIYYPMDLLALLSLVDFAVDQDLRVRAAMLADTLFFEIASNQQHGAFRTTHGRTSFELTADSSKDATSILTWLVTARGSYQQGEHKTAIALALSSQYRIPSVICEIGADESRYSTAAEQHSSASLGFLRDTFNLDFNDPEDGLLLWTYGAFTSPETFRLTLKILETYQWWEHPDFVAFKENREALESLASSDRELEEFAEQYAWDLSRFYLGEANQYTYRTKEYVVSSVQDYRHGFGGHQELVWQAGLGGQAVVFTSHPGSLNIDYYGTKTSTPNYWIGNGILPRVLQRENVVFAIYDLETETNSLFLEEVFNFTHAYFPKNEFDEVVEEYGWVFGRKADAYVGLWSQNGYFWQTEGMYAEKELIAFGKQNLWICELGRQKDYGSFSKFRIQLSQAYILTGGSEETPYIPKEVLTSEGLNGGSDPLYIVYESPRQGMMGVSYHTNTLHRINVYEKTRSFVAGLVSISAGLVLVGAVAIWYGTAVTVLAPAMILGLGVGSAVYNLLAGPPGTMPVFEQSYSAANYGRYNNAYCYAPYPASEIKIESKFHWLFLNYDTVHRYVSDFLDNEAPATESMQDTTMIFEKGSDHY